MSNFVVNVVDLASSKVAALCVEAQPDGRTKVLAGSVQPSQGVLRGAVVDPDAASAAIEAAVGEVEAKTSRRAEALVVALGGAHVRGMESQGVLPIYPPGRAVRREDVMNVVQHSRQTFLPTGREHVFASPRHFRLDGGAEVADPVGMKASRLTVATHVVTGDSNAVSALDRAVKIGGRKVAELIPAPLASGLGVAPRAAIERGCVVVDLGAGTTSVAAFADSGLAFSACLPIGAEHVTTDVATLLNLDRDEAERVKRESGAAVAALVGPQEAVSVRQSGTTDLRPVQRRVLCEVIESRARETADLVRQMLEPTGLLPRMEGGLWLTGGGSLLPGMDEVFMEGLGIAPAGAGSRDAGSAAPSPTMSVAIGLAKYSLAADESELAPVAGTGGWREKVRSIKALLQPRQQDTRT